MLFKILYFTDLAYAGGDHSDGHTHGHGVEFTSEQVIGVIAIVVIAGLVYHFGFNRKK